METASEGAPKRALDKADDGGGTKKLKTDAEDHQFLPTVEKIRNVEDPIKWSLLPSIVYNLLTLFKKTEKSNSDEHKQDKLDNGFKVLSNQYYQEKLLNDSFKHDQLKEVDRYDKISIKESNFKVPNTTKVSIQNLNKLESKSTYLTENVPKIAPLITKALPIQLSAENTDVHKVERQIDDKSIKTTSVVEKKLTPTHNVNHLSVYRKNIPCTVPSINDKAVMSTESVSDAATSANSIYNTSFLASGTDISNTSLYTSTNSVYNVPIVTSKISIPNTPTLISTNSISSTAMLSSANNNTIIVPEDSAHQVISRTENNFRKQIFELLNKNCIIGISKIPLTKPSSCICKYCTTVTSLSIKQSAAYNLLFPLNDNLNHNNSYCDLEISNVPDDIGSISATNDCYLNKLNIPPYKCQKSLINTESPKNIWINQLTSLISKNDTSKKYHKTNKVNASVKLNLQNVINNVHKATQQIKSHLSFCNKCKKSNLNKPGSCKCNVSLSTSYNHNE
ncbi:uncharacterized protein LOC132917967 [Rhopalosiphum padi]|uniref:uncharacterized protein LOC132917967 n=1 Tax=Rhopalosiphum padi TaxID=40932 RepID=UPI00298DFD53|nr:uncharacterized protein LOC132917967 [Rhopalosiphum padi]XP_060834969.1 uncharacterized protein LOC132917967 [Rhopalosiphum padi]XP_060834971.1 uncharacterized protein LOC132917967 [Rhopalosiphum padi]